MRIRPASEQDIEEMHRVRTSVRENRLADPSSVQAPHYRSMLREHGRGWVAEEAGRIVGFAIVDLARANVWALFVDPAREQHGIGRRLHDAMLDSLVAAGVDTVWLSTEPGTRAERFYRSAGWTVTGPQENGEVRFEYDLARRRTAFSASSA